MITNKEISEGLKKKGAILRRMRKRKKLTMIQLAEKSSLSQTRISTIETGVRDYKMGSYIKYMKGLRK